MCFVAVFLCGPSDQSEQTAGGWAAAFALEERECVSLGGSDCRDYTVVCSNTTLIRFWWGSKTVSLHGAEVLNNEPREYFTLIFWGFINVTADMLHKNTVYVMWSMWKNKSDFQVNIVDLSYISGWVMRKMPEVTSRPWPRRWQRNWNVCAAPVWEHGPW